METLDQVLERLKDLESKLFRQVLMSFAFSLVGVLMGEGKFDLAFKALTELVAGTLGTAGILSAYLAGLSHPSSEFEDLLNFISINAGIRVVAGLATAAALFFSFYFYAQLGYRFSTLLLAVGMFFFFRTMTSATLLISKVERQRALWQSLDQASRTAWLEERKIARQRLKQAVEQRKRAEESYEEAKRESDATDKLIRKIKWQTRRWRISSFFTTLWARLYPLRYRLRKRLGLVSWMEDHERLQTMEKALAEGKNKAVRMIRQGEIRPLALEGTGLKLFEINEDKFVLLDGFITEETARSYLNKLAKLRSSPEERFRGITAIVEPTAQLTFEARELLSKEGLELFESQQFDKEESSSASSATSGS